MRKHKIIELWQKEKNSAGKIRAAEKKKVRR
jgi:hypothetical protein